MTGNPDLAGNMTNDTLHTYAFDAENRLTQVTPGATPTAIYTYLGALRVKRQFGGTTIYVYSGTVPIAEYNAGDLLTQPRREYIYSGSQLLATVDASLGTSYQYHDHLSTRVEADTTATVTRTYGHFPFGETWYETGTASKWKFTTYERADTANNESDLDYAENRFDSSRLGRFMGPDALAGDVGDPQSLNRYSYVLGDPVNLVDREGLNPGLGCLLDSNGNCSAVAMSNCTIDHFWAPCSAVYDLVGMGAAANCPQCGVFDRLLQDGTLEHLQPVWIPTTSYMTLGLMVDGTKGWTLHDDLAHWGFGYVSIDFSDAGPPISQDLRDLIFRPWSFGVLVPLKEIPAGPAGVLSFDLDKGFVCLGIGGGVGLRGINGGPLWGNTENSRAILSGASVSVNAAHLVGYQRIENLNGHLHGPSFGSPGISLAVTYSWCSGK